MAKKAIGSLFVTLSASAKRFADDMAAARKAAKKTGQGMKKSYGAAQRSSALLASSLGALKVQILAVAGPAALGLLIKKSIDAADWIAKTADAAGISTNALQEYHHAANLAGVEQEEFNSAVKAFAKRVGEARAGTGTLTTYLNKNNKALLANINSAKSTEEALDLIIGAGAKLETQLDRTALFAAAFGRTAGVAMTNLIKNGTAGLEEMRQEARDLGLVLDEDLLRGAEEAKDAMTRLSGVVKTNVTAAMLAAAPIIEQVSTDLVKVVQSIVELTRAGEDAEKRQILLAAALLEAGEAAQQSRGPFQAWLEDVKEASTVRKLFNDIKQGVEVLNEIDPNTRFIDDMVQLASAATRAKEPIPELVMLWNQVEARLKAVVGAAKDAESAQGTMTDGYREMASAELAAIDTAVQGYQRLTQEQRAWIDRAKTIQTDYSVDTEEWLKTDVDLWRDANQTKFENFQRYVGAISSLGDNLVAAQNARVDAQAAKDRRAAEQTYQARKAALQKQYTVGGQITEVGLKKLGDLEEQYAARRENIDARAEEKKRQQARRLRGIKYAQAISNTAAAVIEGLKLGGPPLAAIYAAIGAAQIATIRAQPYAKGGIVGEPTFFTNSGRLSVMGEAGKEAIMPVTRTSGGDLGVKVDLPDIMPNLNFTVNFSGPVTDKDYAVNVIGKALEEASRKNYSRLAVKR